jgi:hypothetical protein
MGYGWRKIWDVDFTEAQYADAGTSTPGARVIGGKNAVIINPSSNFLAPAAGVSVVSGTGLKFDTTGCTTGPADDLVHSLGAGVYWSLSELVPAALWPNTQPGPEKYWSQLAVVGRFDLSGCDGNGEGIGVAIGSNTSFGTGASASCVRASGAGAHIGALYTGTYNSATSSIAQLGISSAADSAMVVVSSAGATAWWGVSDGTRYWPRDWYTRDQYMAISLVQNAASTGGMIRNLGVVAVTVWDTAKTAATPIVKRLSVFGRYQGSMTPMGPSSRHFVAA